MEKEKVLEKEYQEVFDSVVFRIKYQNDEILKRGNFHDEETGVESCWTPEYVKHNNKLYIQGKEKDKDNIVLLVDKEDFKKILEIVNKINEKYGILKRWRAKENEEYYFLNGKCEIWKTIEEKKKVDNTLFEQGNYFKTKGEAEKVKEELDKFWEKVRAGEIGGRR